MAGMSFSAHISNKKSGITSKTKLEGVAKHNLRKYKSSDYSANNIVILQGTKNLVRDVKSVYHQEFDAALKEYNERQKREDRKIEDYFEHVANKEQDMAVEIIIQLGDREYWKEHETDRSFMKYIYEDMLDELERLFPDFIVANAVVHLDEDSPHMHVVGVPVAEGYTRGLYKQVSKRSVFTSEKLSVFLQGELREYANYKVNLLFDEQIKEKTKGRNHDLTVAEYKVTKEIEKYDKVKEQVTDKKRELEVLEEQGKEILERAKRAEQAYEFIKDMGADSLRRHMIDTMVENQELKEQNASLRENLKKAYDFMEKIVIDGRNMLERFRESLTETVVRTIDKVRSGPKR